MATETIEYQTIQAIILEEFPELEGSSFRGVGDVIRKRPWSLLDWLDYSGGSGGSMDVYVYPSETDEDRAELEKRVAHFREVKGAYNDRSDLALSFDDDCGRSLMEHLCNCGLIEQGHYLMRIRY